MTHLLATSSEAIELAPANRARLARYLGLPSVAQIDPVTDAEICKLDQRREELLSFRQRAVMAPIERIDGHRIELSGRAPVESTQAYGNRLTESGADALIVAAFTLGGRVDDLVTDHLRRDELFEGYVLKQWA